MEEGRRELQHMADLHMFLLQSHGRQESKTNF